MSRGFRHAGRQLLRGSCLRAQHQGPTPVNTQGQNEKMILVRWSASAQLSGLIWSSAGKNHAEGEQTLRVLRNQAGSPWGGSGYTSVPSGRWVRVHGWGGRARGEVHGRDGRALSGGQRCPSRAPRERVVPGLRTGAPIRGHLFSQQETIYSPPLSLHCCLETRSSCVRMREWRMARG